MEDFVLFVDTFGSLAIFRASGRDLPIAMIQNDSNEVEKILNIIRYTLELLCKSSEKLPLGWQSWFLSANFFDDLIKLFGLFESLWAAHQGVEELKILKSTDPFGDNWLKIFSYILDAL